MYLDSIPFRTLSARSVELGISLKNANSLIGCGLGNSFDIHKLSFRIGTSLTHLLDEVERVADRVAIIHHGQIMLTASMEEIKEQHRRVTLRFEQALDSPPELIGSLSSTGHGKEWTYVCSGETSQLRNAAEAIGATVVEEASLTLDEIFISRIL